jgi:hypothetical protein
MSARKGTCDGRFKKGVGKRCQGQFQRGRRNIVVVADNIYLSGRGHRRQSAGGGLLGWLKKTCPDAGLRMKLDDMPAVIAVQERDIDLLILEELHATPAFAAWWGERIGLNDAAFDGAWHSVSNADGETDVLLRVRVGAGRVGVLIENKIAASEQLQQDERYHRRGVQGLAEGWFDRYVTCMVAPQ